MGGSSGKGDTRRDESKDVDGKKKWRGHGRLLTRRLGRITIW